MSSRQSKFSMLIVLSVVVAYCEAVVGGKCLAPKESWSFMHLLCSGMVGFGLRRNLGTAEKEHPFPPLPPPMVGEVLALWRERNHLLAV